MPPLLLISSVPALSSGKKTTEATVRGRTAQEKRGREKGELSPSLRCAVGEQISQCGAFGHD